jgi:hypothetical protein
VNQDTEAISFRKLYKPSDILFSVDIVARIACEFEKPESMVYRITGALLSPFRCVGSSSPHAFVDVNESMGVIQEVLPFEVIPEIYAHSRFDIRIMIDPIWELRLIRPESFVLAPVCLPL